MPECALEFHDLAHFTHRFVVRKSPLAPNREVQNVSRKRRAVDAVVSTDKERIDCLVPSAMKRLATIVCAKARGQRPFSRKLLPIEMHIHSRRAIELRMRQRRYA